MGTWKTLKDADGKGGVRYREHLSRKHGAVPDRYYTIAYWWQGKTVSEGIGWASEKWTPNKCFELLAQLKENQATGKGPCTLTEMREQFELEKSTKRKMLATEELMNVSFKTFFDDVFLPDAKGRWAAGTTVKAVQHVNTWINPVTGNIPMRELGLTHINRIKANLSGAGKSARTQQYVFRTFAMVWNAALDHGLVSGPCPTKLSSFRLPKVDNERGRYLTLDEETALLEAVASISKQAHDMTVVALDAGLRFGEIAVLTWGCLDVINGVIRVLDTKSGKDRNVPMTTRLKELFESMPVGNPGAPVFPNRLGCIQTQVPSAFKRAVKSSGLNDGVANKKMRVCFHTCRHTAASKLVQAGVDLYRVQRILGHSTPVMTARYGKLADSDLQDAIKAMERDTVVKRSNGKVLPLRRKIENE